MEHLEDWQVHYTVKQPIPIETEHSFLRMLEKWSTYLTVDATTHRLIGYGIPKWNNDNFLFWLHVGLMREDDD